MTSEIEQALELGNKSISLVDRMLGPVLTRRQADADSQAILQVALAEQIADQFAIYPNDPVLLDAIVSCGGKTGLTNLIKILQQASPQLTEGTNLALVSDDWFANFKEKARTCSDPDMATLWAQLLAGEGNHPGSYSRKTVNIFSDMEPRDAKLFSDLCRFQIMVHGKCIERMPLILKEDADIYVKHGVTRSGLLALHDLQLINFTGVRPGAIGIGASVMLAFFAHSDGMVVLISNDGQSKLCQVDTGDVSFTKTGAEMSNLCLPMETPAGFVDYLTNEWSHRLRGFTVEQRPLNVSFLNGTFEARPDLGKIVGPLPD